MSFTHKDAETEKAIFEWRAIIAACLVAALLCVLAARMTFLQVNQHELYASKSENNRVQFKPVAPIRGLIFDRNGILLAENLPSHSLSVVPERVQDMKNTLGLINTLVGLSASEKKRFEKRLKEWRRPFEPITIKYRLNESEIAKLMVNAYFLEGVEVEAELVRHYPRGKDFAHVLGYVGQMNEKEKRILDAARYKATRRVGKIGIERFYQDKLHGEVGYQKVETNAQGRILDVLERKNPKPGQNLILNLDANLQHIAMEAFDGRRGSLVAINPKTGGILAMVSSPSFDPNLFVNGISFNDYNRLRDSLDKPLFDRASRGQYPPGSTMKPFIGLSFLESGTTQWSEKINDPGWYMLENDERVYRDWKRSGHGSQIGLRQAIIQSCDVYFYEMSFRAGIDNISPFLGKFGFGENTALDVGNALPALLPDRAWKKKYRGHSWYAGDTLNMGLGQGFMLTTPLQLATAMSVFANKGKWHQAKLVQYIDGKELTDTALLKDIKIKNPQDWDRMGLAMEGVIKHYLGTARVLNRKLNYRLAGKTGTAQVVGIKQNEEYDSEALLERQRDHALFVSYAPIGAPEIAIAVIVENGESAGRTAGPIARKVTDFYLHSLKQRPKINSDAFGLSNIGTRL
jgi:penicillin-binding protein 2